MPIVLKSGNLNLLEPPLLLYIVNGKFQLLHVSAFDEVLDWRVGLVFLRLNRLFEDGCPVPKHVAVETQHELNFVI